VSDPGAPPPDWNAIFDRAHRRILGRLLLLGGIGAVCAVLLLGSGLSAQGAVRWRIGPFASADATTPTTGTVKIDHKVKRQAAAQVRRRARFHRRHKHHRHHHHPHHHHDNGGGGGGENGNGGTEACPVGQIDSSGEQYEEWILTATGECVQVPVKPPEGSGGTEGGGSNPQGAPAR
jgi:hypothetical protein